MIASKIACRVVPVDLGDVSQPNARELVARADRTRMGLRSAAEALEIVVVDRGDDVGEPERGGHQHRLPGRAFLHLAVAEDRVDPCHRSCGRARRAPSRTAIDSPWPSEPVDASIPGLP